MSAPSVSRRRPRLAYLYSRYPVISHTFIDNEILGLEAAGWEVVIGALHPAHDTVRHPRLNDLRAPVLHAPPSAVRKAMEARWRNAGRWPLALLEKHAAVYGLGPRSEASCRNVAWFADMLPRLGVEHVHLHFSNQATHSALFLKAMTGIPFSFTPQAQDFLVDIPSPGLLAEMCEEAEFVVAPCDFARSELARLCPASAGKLVRVYNGIEPSGYPAARPAPRDGSLRVISVGRLIEFKGFHHLLRAVALARAQGVRVRLDLMGDGPWRETLEKLVAECALGDQVTFHGTVDIEQMKAGFAKADAFALACIVDAKGAADMLPTVITEAMLSGLPVVSSRLAGVPEQVVDGETGFLTAPGDEAALAQALVRLASEPGLAARMGEAGRRRAVERFAMSATLPVLGARLEESPRRTERSLPGTLVAFYDLSVPESIALLEVERPVLAALGAQVWLAGGTLTKKEALRLGAALDGVFWMPDDVALDLEWNSRTKERERLEACRAEVGGGVGAARFSMAAKQALWLAMQMSRLAKVERLYAPGDDEALVAWLAHRLSGVPFLAACESADALAPPVVATCRGLAVTTAANPLRRRTRAQGKPRGWLRGLHRAVCRASLRRWLKRA